LRVIFVSDALNARPPVKARADGLIGLDESVQLLGQILVLALQNADVALQSLNLSQQLRVQLVQMIALEAERLRILPQDINKVFSLANVVLQLCNLCCEFLVASGLSLKAALDLTVFSP